MYMTSGEQARCKCISYGAFLCSGACGCEEFACKGPDGC
jgi:hypothetical protein